MLLSGFHVGGGLSVVHATGLTAGMGTRAGLAVVARLRASIRRRVYEGRRAFEVCDAGAVVGLLSKVCLRVFWCAAYVPIQGSPGPSSRFELTLACVVPSRSVAIAQH